MWECLDSIFSYDFVDRERELRDQPRLRNFMAAVSDYPALQQYLANRVGPVEYIAQRV